MTWSDVLYHRFTLCNTLQHDTSFWTLARLVPLLERV
jgi:hypothetical protein